MRVRLIEWSRSPVTLAAVAALRCTHADRFDRLCELAAEDPGRIVERVTESGHGSVLEHAVFTFSVEGISRVTSHQLVRHRLASYSQQSQRYTAPDLQRIVLPPTVMQSVDGNPAIRDALEAWDLATARAIGMLKGSGVPDEDIRYILPQGTETALIVTMNLRELSHFCGLRMCNRAQWEIRELAVKMAAAVVSVEPGLTNLLEPQCARLGYCPEGRRGCGHRPAPGAVIRADDIGEGEE